MNYAIISQDVKNSLLIRQSVREKHLARLEQLREEGRLIIAGPHPMIDSEEPGEAGFSGSLIVAKFSSLESAKQWADDDPYVKAGVYQSVDVKPFKRVY